MDFLIDLTIYRLQDRLANGKTDPIVINVVYAQDNQIYQDGRIVCVDDALYAKVKIARPNDLVNKFGHAYAVGSKLLLHRKLADVLIDAAIDMRDRHEQFTVVMDGLRTFDSGSVLAQNRPDLVAAKLLAPAGTSAHNRALAVDSKLFELIDKTKPAPRVITLDMLKEADEKGHMDDLNMTTSNRFYAIAESEPAFHNRRNRIRAWQRAAVKNNLAVANLIAEFWDDRVPGSPADMWRVATCRALCITVDGNPKTNTALGILKMNLETLHAEHQQGKHSREVFASSAHAMLTVAWDQIFTPENRRELERVLGQSGGNPPALADFIFHEWLPDIHDSDLVDAGFDAQTINSALPAAKKVVH